MPSVSEKFSRSKEKVARRGTGPRCASCKAPIVRQGCCVPCWDELKTFRRYLRLALRLAPLYGDVPPAEQGERVRVYPSQLFEFFSDGMKGRRRSSS